MSLELAVKILQVGFSGFVFLMALFSYNLIRKEQDRPGDPRPEILKELKGFRTWAVSVSVLVLASSLLDSTLRQYFDVKPSQVAGSAVCLLRNTIISRSSPVGIPNFGDWKIHLKSTQVGVGGNQPRGASVAILEGPNETERFFRENGSENLSIRGDNYQVEVTDVRENTVVISICRDI